MEHSSSTKALTSSSADVISFNPADGSYGPSFVDGGSSPTEAISGLEQERSAKPRPSSFSHRRFVESTHVGCQPVPQIRGLDNPIMLRPKKQHRGSNSRRTKNVLVILASSLVAFFILDCWFLTCFRKFASTSDDGLDLPTNLALDEGNGLLNHQRPLHIMFQHLYTLAAHALAEGELKSEPDDSWKEPYDETSAWKPCSDDLDNEMSSSYSKKTNTGYIMVSANGGLNQQRVAICNAVAVARLLNATLVIPKFLYSSVWQDNSQFGDIYQQDFFIDYLKNDITIVRDLPLELRSLDLEAIGSFVTDMDVAKEAKTAFYKTYILPILLRNRVVHFYGFGHRLSFDPIPFNIQRLRCKCNFHALKFTPQIQKIAALLIQRMREQSNRWGPVLDEPDIPGYANHTQTQVISHLIVDTLNNGENILESKGLFHNVRKRTFRYLGLHLRFEIDMAAYSMCDFGGGEIERHELERYREIHFPTLWTYQKKGKLPTAVELRKHGKCPLMPEESVLMLAALGFKRATRVYLAGAEFYGSSARMAALTYLYPNLVTKEDLLTPEELRPLINSSSQLAALDFIVCAAADAFAMTDSGSQFSSLVSGYRIYYGGGLLPTIRPNKRRLAAIFAKNKTIEWQEFSTRVRKTIKESKKVTVRPIARSVYRHPRCPECMCRKSNTDGPKRP